MRKITESAYAKINLTLDILDKRADGYHNLKSIMATVSLADAVEVEVTDSRKIEIFCDDKTIPCNERNIAYKAAEAFFKHMNFENPGISITICKKTPSQAGLGGGSADGAAVLRALYTLFFGKTDSEKSKNRVTIFEAAAEVGADVPFCVVGGFCLCRGTGTEIDRLSPPSDFHEYTIIIAKPEVSVSTVEAYRLVDKNVKKGTFYTERYLERYSQKNTLGNILDVLGNDFEEALGLPEISDIKSIMMKSGAENAVMSGSGSAVYGVFSSEYIARVCSDKLLSVYKDVFLCKIVGETLL